MHKPIDHEDYDYLYEISIEELKDEIRSCGDPEDAPNAFISREWEQFMKVAREVLRQRLEEESE